MATNAILYCGLSPEAEERAFRYESPSMSVKRAWDWSTVTTCFPHGPEIAVRVAGVQTTVQNCTGGHATICLIIRKRYHLKFRKCVHLL